jgi:hypothetical protein
VATQTSEAAEVGVTDDDLQAFASELHDLINVGDVETLLERCADDVIVCTPGLVRASPPIYRGHCGLREWWLAVTERGALSFTVHRIDVDDEQASVFGWITTRRGSGGLMTRAKWRWRLSQGLVVSLEIRSDGDWRSWASMVW